MKPERELNNRPSRDHSPLTIDPLPLRPMKPFSSLSAIVVLSFTGMASLPAQEKPARPAAPPAAAPSADANTTTTVTEERTTTVVFPDPTLDKLEGKVVRIDGEKKQLLLRTKNGKEPIPYNVNLATRYVDLDGKPVSPALIIAEVPVEVRYVENGSELIASTVIVQRYQAPLPGGGVTLTNRETLKAGGKVIAETLQTTETTKTTGEAVKPTATSRPVTLGAMEKGVLTVTGDADAAPLRYQYSEATQWVNAIGEPLPLATIKPGYVVKVTYTQRGEAFFAERIVVLPPGAVPAPATNPGTAPTPTQGALPAPVPQNPARD